MTSLTEHTMAIAEILKARGETVAVAETSAGGLVSAQLLAVPGASAYFMGGGVLYTGDAREGLAGESRKQTSRACAQAVSLMPNCWPKPCARNWAPPGGWLKPGRPDHREIAMATTPATHASLFRDRFRWCKHWKPGTMTAVKTCGSSRTRHWRYFGPA